MWLQWYSFFVLLGYTMAASVEAIDDSLQNQCPIPTCNCQSMNIENLPIFSAMGINKLNEKKTKETVEENPKIHQNEVLEEDDFKKGKTRESQFLTTAMCVLSVGINVNALLSSLPTRLEVLIIFQTTGAGNLTLEASHFTNLQGLKVLEIHGYNNNGEIEHLSTISLNHNVFNELKSLQYLNLEHIQLLGEVEEDNKPAPILETISLASMEDISNSISVINKISSDQHQIINSLEHQLKFLSEPSDSKILPYETYKQNQEYSNFFTFSGLSHLKVLRIYHCNVKNLRWEMFDGLHNLDQLSLEGNLLLFLPEFSFYGTPALKYLCLSHNNLLNIKTTNLIGLLQLEQLDISYNNLSHLSELSLPPFPNLKSADFHHNPIERIIPYTFDIMNVTEELYIGGYEAPFKIQPNTFHGLHNILKLGIINVQLHVLEKDHLKGMPKLKELKLQGKIELLSYDAFLEVSKLQVLVLRNCSLFRVSMDSFFGLNNLLYLDLSENLLEILPTGLFDHQISLQELNLRNNRLTKLPVGIFSNLNLHMVRLDLNPWHCTCRMGEWNPHVVNKIKIRTLNNPKCQFRFDKGSMCNLEPVFHYVYDKKTTPRCASPHKYKGWSVFHLLRKVLRCEKKQKLDSKELYTLEKLKKKEHYKRLYDVIKYKKVKTPKQVTTEKYFNITRKLEILKIPTITTLNDRHVDEQYPKQNNEVENDLNVLDSFNHPVYSFQKNPSETLDVLREVSLNFSVTPLYIHNETSTELSSKSVELVPKATFLPLTQIQAKNHTSNNKLIGEEKSQNVTDSMLSRYDKLNSKPIKNYQRDDPDVIKAKKMKLSKDRFYEKVYKTIKKM